MGASAREETDRAERIGIATISVWEIAMLFQRGRISLDRPVERWFAHAVGHPRVLALDLTPSIALRAGMLDRERFLGDLADRVIYASARIWDARLATKDGAIRAFDPRLTAWE